MFFSDVAYRLILPVKDVVQSIILTRYYKKRWGGIDEELQELVHYVEKHHKVRALNYSFVDKYAEMDIAVCKDRECGMHYVLHNGKRMYFSKEMQSRKEIERYYRGIAEEQDEESPHRYLTKAFNVRHGDVVVDAGVAEGNFSLDVLSVAGKLILIESENEWVKALEQTFKKEIEAGKVVIINKFLGKSDDASTVSLDFLYKTYGKINFVKMDIEGMEQEALRGGKKLLKEETGLRLAVCAYHTPAAYDEIVNILEDFRLEHTKKYMVLNPLFGWKPPYARRGVIRAEKTVGI